MSAPPEGSRAEQIYDQFLEFHKNHPEVWTLFEKYAQEAISSGLTHYSARAVVHRIRWYATVEMKSGEDFKINNNFSPYYGRLFMHRHPEHRGFFRVRIRRSEKYSAFDHEPMVDPADPEWS